MAADKWRRYNKFPLYMGDGTIDLDTDTIKMALYLSTSNAATLSNSILGDLTNQHAGNNGYTTGGVTCAATFTESSGTETFDFADAVWTASAGNIVARYAVLYVNVTRNTIVNPLIAYCLMDNTPADVTVVDGNSLTVQINASGVFTISGGQTA